MYFVVCFGSYIFNILLSLHADISHFYPPFTLRPNCHYILLYLGYVPFIATSELCHYILLDLGSVPFIDTFFFTWTANYMYSSHRFVMVR